eukprot:9185541-Pyramimonas_sp.AAC.1
MATLTFVQFFKKYVLKKPSESLRTPTVGTTTFGYHIYAAPENHVVRFTDFHPSKQVEGYSYNVLLDHIPFKSEHELISRTNSSGTYVQELFERGILASEDQLHNLADAYATYHLYANEARHALFDALLVNIQRFDVDALGSSENASGGLNVPQLQLEMHNVLEDLGGPNPFQNSTASETIVSNNSLQNDMNDQSNTLTVAQQTVFDTLTNIHQTGLHVLSGSPGAGKTFVTQQIIHSLHARNEHVILCGTAGAAATRLHSNAMT